MNENEIIKTILTKYKTIAVYGMSANEEKAAHSVPAYLAEHNYIVIPINPHHSDILGRRCYKTIEEVTDKIEILLVFRPSNEVFDIVKCAIARKKNVGDIFAIWLQSGIFDNEARDLAVKNDIAFVQDRCMYVEHRNLRFSE